MSGYRGRVPMEEHMKRIVACSAAVILLGLASGASAEPGMRIDPDPIGFGGQGMLTLGGMPGEQQFGIYTITNTGTSVLKVKEMTITGAAAGIITFEDGVCGQGTSCSHKFDVPPGGQAYFSVGCVAPAAGTFAATLHVKSNASGPETAPLICNGLHPPVIAVSPGLDFGTAHGCWFGDLCGPRCNTKPATQTLTITNTAAAPSELDFSMVLPQDGPSWDFTIESDQQPSYVLTAGQSLNITFTFHPMSPNGADTYDGLTLTPTYPSGLAPIAVPFHAHKGWGRLVIDTPPFLGSVAVGQTLTTTITAHDGGDSCLDLLHVTSWQDVTRVDADTGGALLQAGESHSWTVTCTAPGENGGSGGLDFDIYGDDPEFEFHPFYCQAAGAGLWTYPTSVSFDDAQVPVGSSGTIELSLFNPGDQPTDLVAMTPSDPHYTIALASGSLPLTLGPGDTTPIDVTFSPTDDTRIDATILLDASVGADYTLPVSGAGVTSSPLRHGASHRADVAPAETDDDAPGGGCGSGGGGSLPVALVVALVALRQRRPRRGRCSIVSST
jgi:hypothetical protein